MIQRMLMAAAVAASVLGAGCEWTSSGGGNSSWNDAYGWVDFSGVYRNPNGGPVVSGMAASSGTDASSRDDAYTIGQTTGVGGSADTTYGGVLRNTPVVPKTFTVRVYTGNTPYSVATFNDNGNGNLTQDQGGGIGTINYTTGAWSITVAGVLLSSGENIDVSYSYVVGGTEGVNNPGNSGNAVYSLTVNQTGNRVAITDSRGMAFSGQVTGTSGTSDQSVAGNVRLVFEVANGDGSVKIRGAFSGDWSGSTVDQAGTLSNRRIEGTWIERSVQGDINGVSGSISITPNAVVAP